MEKEITLKVKYRVLGEVTFPLTDTNPDYTPQPYDTRVIVLPWWNGCEEGAGPPYSYVVLEQALNSNLEWYPNPCYLDEDDGAQFIWGPNNVRDIDVDAEEEGVYVIEGSGGKLRLAQLPVSVVGY